MVVLHKTSFAVAILLGKASETSWGKSWNTSSTFNSMAWLYLSCWELWSRRRDSSIWVRSWANSTRHPIAFGGTKHQNLNVTVFPTTVYHSVTRFYPMRIIVGTWFDFKTHRSNISIDNRWETPWTTGSRRLRICQYCSCRKIKINEKTCQGKGNCFKLLASRSFDMSRSNGS